MTRSGLHEHRPDISGCFEKTLELGQDILGDDSGVCVEAAHKHGRVGLSESQSLEYMRRSCQRVRSRDIGAFASLSVFESIELQRCCAGHQEMHGDVRRGIVGP